jgi:hypothetical protein
MDPDLDPGGPKTRGSGGSGFGCGSATLEVANLPFIVVNYFLFRCDVPHASSVRGQGYPLRLHASKTGSVQHFSSLYKFRDVFYALATCHE